MHTRLATFPVKPLPVQHSEEIDFHEKKILTLLYHPHVLPYFTDRSRAVLTDISELRNLQTTLSDCLNQLTPW